MFVQPALIEKTSQLSPTMNYLPLFFTTLVDVKGNWAILIVSGNLGTEFFRMRMS